MKALAAFFVVLVVLILRRTRFRNRYPVMSDEWIEMQGKEQ